MPGCHTFLVRRTEKFIALHAEENQRNKNMKKVCNILMMCFTIMAVMASCQSKKNKKMEGLAPNVQQVVAEEVIQTSQYTYVRVLSTDEKSYWIAINSSEIKEGQTYFWSQGMEMTNFTSRELKRTFPSIYFISDFTDKPILASGQNKPDLKAASMAGKQQAPEKPGVSVQKYPGGYTIAELYAKKESFAGKKVSVRGEVVKFSSQIMNKNWVHIQDGTNESGFYDLTITTRDSVAVGNVVVFEGQLSVNKDFGAGYKYDIVMEDGLLKK
jgi:hypothetical protein